MAFQLQDFQMRDGLTRDSKEWINSKLLELSLDALPRSLSDSASKQQILSIYLDWLQVHRVNPSDLSKDWETTILQWVQALQLLGFDRDELVNEVRKWRKDNEPFQPPPASWPFKRHRPMPYDIVKSWPKPGYGSSAPQKGFPSQPGKAEDFSGNPPGNYICNRCGFRGHFLEACPTNLDPFYDRAPSMNYCCPLCKKCGDHYKSICPLNPDPFSIIQKRKALGIETSGEADWNRGTEKHQDDNLLEECDRGRSTAVDARSTANHASLELGHENDTTATSPSKSIKKKRGTEEVSKRIDSIDDLNCRLQQSHSSGSIGSICTEDVKMFRDSYDASKSSQKRTRAVSPDSADTRSRRSINEQSPSPTKARILRNKIAAIEYAEKYGTHHATMGPSNYFAQKAALLAELHEEEKKRGRMDRDYAVKTEDGGADGGREPFAKRSKTTSSGQELSRDMDIDNEEPRSTAKAPIMKHSEFIRKLMERHPGMQETVNRARRRPTALYMWNDDDDDRRMKQLSIKNQKNASPSPFDDDKDDREARLAKYEREIMEMNRSSEMQLDSPTLDRPSSPSVSPASKDDMDHESDWS